AVQFLAAADRGPDAGPVGEVHGHRVGGASADADLLDQLVEGVGAAGGEHDRGAFPGEEPGGGRSDAAAGAGDEHDLAGEEADGGSWVDGGVVRHVIRVSADGDRHPGTGGTWVGGRAGGRLGVWTSTSSGRSSAAVASGSGRKTSVSPPDRGAGPRGSGARRSRSSRTSPPSTTCGSSRGGRRGRRARSWPGSRAR